MASDTLLDATPLGLLLDTALDAVVVIDGAGLVLGWNRVAEEIFGWSAGEAIGGSMTGLIVPAQHRPGHRRGMRRFQETGVATVLNRRIEISALHKDGREFPVELSITTAGTDAGPIFVGHLRDISERHRAERALRDAQAEAAALAAERSAILSQLAESVIVTDAAGRISFVNEAAARLHGVVQLDVEPDDYSATYHLLTEDGRPYPTERLPLARAVRGETVSDARWRIRRPDGTEVLAIGSARPLVDADNVQVGAVLTARDDTEREGAERRVRESEVRLRALTDNLPGGAVYQVSSGADGNDRRFLYLSHSYEKMTGIPADAVLSDASLAYGRIEPEDLPRLAEAERVALENKTSMDVQVRFRHVDGTPKWCRIISAPRDLPDGSLVWDGLKIDATARIEAEIALRDLNQTLEHRVAEMVAERERIWNVSRDLFVICGFDGLYREVNPAWTSLLGHAEADLVGAGFDSLVHPDDRELAREQMQRILEGAPVDSFDVRIRAADGSYRWISWTCVPETDSFYAAGRDITDRMRLEEQLRQSQKMEAVGQLTGGVAHDFNNLLTIIRSAVDLMRRRDLPEDRRSHYVDAISQTVDRASKLTGQLLAFARRQPLKPELFEVGPQISTVAELMRPLLGPRIKVELDLPAEPCFARLDIGQFETALINLALNARDAMASEGPLRVALRPADGIPPLRGRLRRSGRYLAIAVSDQGSGIAAGDIEQIFEPFFTTKEVGRGTGLGLSQVYGFTQQSGGDIALESTPGEGSTFTLFLPAAPDGAPTEDRREGASGRPAGKGTTILVVEDDESVGRFSTEMLHDLGYATTWVADAEEALARIEQDELGFDIVFSDVIMPGMNGVDLARTIRERHPGLPVVLTSGYSDVLAQEGSHGFELLQKPYSVEALSRILRKAMAG
jgi:PAS domain S-box-containing protein